MSGAGRAAALAVLAGTARVEARMQVRKRSLWVSSGLLLGVLALFSHGQLVKVVTEPRASTAVVQATMIVGLLLPLVSGCVLADRLIRDLHTGVAPLFDATPAGVTARLLGKYLGCCAATGAPAALVQVAFGVGWVAWHGEVSALGWTVVALATVQVPAVLFVGAFALLCPLVMPAPLFRVLFVGYWFWGNGVSPRLMPTLSGTVLCPLSGYQFQVFFRYSGPDTSGFAGPMAGASLNVLRPPPSVPVALASIGLLLLCAVLALVAARALVTGAVKGRAG